MNKKIIFLESATKKKTIQSFLGKDYVIFATSGHLWELKKQGIYNLGVDLENFSPSYEIMSEKKRFINSWKKFLKEHEIDVVYLATDPDREGEAIAKALSKTLNLSDDKYKRLLFREITPNSIKQSLENPVCIDENLVEAQLSRQVLDRMIGFCLSSVLRTKLKTAFSAGRVQSIVLKLIIDREQLVNDCTKIKEYIVCGVFILDGKEFLLKQVDNNYNLLLYKKKEEAEEIKNNLAKKFKKEEEKKEIKFIIPKSPLITSLLLFEARSQLGFSVEQTTKIAQRLYEGIYIKNKERQIGLITYPRTDAERYNSNYIGSSYNYILKKWGKEYYNHNPIWVSKEKKTNIQNAHESIHPTYLDNDPEIIKDSLSSEEYSLYKLIFNHSLASLMSPAKTEKVTYIFSNNNFLFSISEKKVLFSGFLSCYEEKFVFGRYKVRGKLQLSEFEEIISDNNDIREYLENKPIRYNEGSMVQDLERMGIGRPSTYNAFGKILIKRGYVELDRKGFFYPTVLGTKVNHWLQDNFSSLINENYTAELERELDKISVGKNNYYNFISTFWNNFNDSLKKLV